MTAQCTEILSHSNIKVEENKRKAIFLNPSKAEFSVTKIDGCLVTGEEIRCDYLVSEIGEASALVELKGKDVSHACDQLLASARHNKVKPLLEDKIGFLVVCSKYPRFDTFVAKAKQRAAKEFKAGFHVVCDRGEFNIRDLVRIDGGKRGG